MRERIHKIIRQTCKEMGVHIVRGVLAHDPVHMFQSIPPKLWLSNVMPRIRGRSSQRIQMAFPNCASAAGACGFGRQDASR
jgi:putative transposase